jgi:hypothetical protein
MPNLNDPKLSPENELGAALIARGLVENEFVLNLNRGLTVPYELELPYPWNLPSRAFRFPIEVSEDRPRRIGLVHPRLIDHPWVQTVQEAIGQKIDPEGVPNDCGFSKRALAPWWHAVDLISSGHWKDLLDTDRFTTPDCIAEAVAFGLHYSGNDKKRNGCLTAVEARKIMAHLGLVEPSSPSGLLRHFLPPCPQTSEKGRESWPLNFFTDRSDEHAWSLILGIESRWFAYDRNGHLRWTPLGRERFDAVAEHPDVLNEDEEELDLDRSDLPTFTHQTGQQLTLF